MNLYHTGLSELYKEIETLGDPLTGLSDRIDFEMIRSILSDLFTNDTDKGGKGDQGSHLIHELPGISREITGSKHNMVFP